MISIKKVEQLHLWGKYDNTEVGDVWRTLANLYIESRDYISSELLEALSVELESNYKIAKAMVKSGTIHKLKYEMVL